MFQKRKYEKLMDKDGHQVMTLTLLWPFRPSELKLNDTFAHILKNKNITT